MKEQSTTNYLNELIEVLIQNLIYYIPSSIIIEGVLDQLRGDLPDSFFDDLSLFDFDKGVCEISNEDAFEINQRLLNKRLQLEENIFKLESKNKELEPVAFEIIVQKYYDQLIFGLFITDWLIINLKKYHQDEVNLSLIGSFKLQHEYLKTHLKDILAYFGNTIDIEKEYSFSSETLVMEYLPDLLSRLNPVENNRVTENHNQDCSIEPTEKINWYPDKPKSKRTRPEISNEKIEKMILESVFKIKI